MRKVLPWSALLFLFWVPALSDAPTPDRDQRKLVFRTPYPIWTVPAMANSPGRFGAHFKTRVVIYNPTLFSYLISAKLYGPNGAVAVRSIAIEREQYLVWDNFLEDVFNYRGAGAVEFDSWFDPPGGSDDHEYSITAEVYTDSPNGRYSTVVIDGDGSDAVFFGSRAIPGLVVVNPGITVNEMQRVNVGLFNEWPGTSTILAHVGDADGNIVQTIEFNVPAYSWAQKSINARVENGFVSWTCETSTCAAYLWAVTVDNQSNDGRFLPPIHYTPHDDP